MTFFTKEAKEAKVLEHCKAELCVNHLSKSYGNQLVIDDLSISLKAGESLSIIGPSGCGKSTLLYLLAGLDLPNAGNIKFISPEGNENFFAKHKRSPRISYVMQEYGLFPWKSAEENLALPLILNKIPLFQQKELISQMLNELGLEGINKKFPSELSGGQRQRLALGRALILKPEILLLDEPLSSVDAITRENLQKIIFELWEKYSFTFILVTHSINEALFLGKDIMVMKKIHKHSTKNEILSLQNPCFGERNLQESQGFATMYKVLSMHLAEAY